MQATDFANMRALAKECADVPSVRLYVLNTAQRIYKMMKFLGISEDEIASRLHNEDTTSAGQVSKHDVLKLVKPTENKERGNDANIRELNTLVMNFAANNCDVVWKLMIRARSGQKLPAYVNKSALLNRIRLIEQATGVNFDTLISICASEEGDACKLKDRLIFHKNGFPLECHLASRSRDGPVTLARTTQPAFRRPRNKNGLASKRIARTDVYPPLSPREARFIGAALEDDGYLPWTTGFMYWDIRPDKKSKEYNMFTYLAKKFNQEIVCGPSANTDLQLGTYELFNKKTELALHKGILSCIAWMCNPPDHSPYEILLAANSFGLGYDVQKDPYSYVHHMMRSITS
jgi:hypothetical protein